MTSAWLPRCLSLRAGWLLVAVLVCCAELVDLAALRRLDLLLYDVIEPLARPAGTKPQTAIVAIDERSLAALGRWPWTRELHADLIDRLTDAQVTAIGMAILFPEPTAGDDRLAQSLRRSGRVVLAVAPSGAGPGMTGMREVLPTPELTAAAATLGHVDVELDADALARRTFRQAGTVAPKWNALSLAVWELAHHRAGVARLSAGADDGRVPPTPLAWVRAGEMLLPYPDRRSALPMFSSFDILTNPVLAAQLRDKAVFVGTTATGLAAALATPAPANAAPMAAVEFHARAHEALRNGQVYRTADKSLTLPFTLVFLALPAILYPLLGLRWAIASGCLALLPLLASAITLYLTRIWIPPSTAITGFVAGYLLWFAMYLKRTRGSLQRARLNADATLRSIADAVITVDGRARVVFMNPVAERLTGARLGDAQGQAASKFLAPFCADSRQVETMLTACVEAHEVIRLADPIAWTTPEGQQYALRTTITPIGTGRDGAVLALSDVTEVIAVTSRLQHEATHDPLTGLPNRTLLLDRLRQSLAHTRRKGSLVALLFVDLDRFKRINDSLGHQWGDRVLKIVAERLQAAVRAEDTVARWGGDEFIVLMDNVGDRVAIASVAAKVLDLLDREVDSEDGSGLVLSGSIGISLGPLDSENADTLLSMADQAMYRGKLEGGGNFTFYSAEMNTWSRDRLSLESALRRALVDREFELHYQPQIEIASGRLVGFESLIRWRRPGAGLIRPDTFIPAAEESGLIRTIGEWVIDEATAQVARWTAAGLTPVPVAVNVSARQCSDMTIIETIGSALTHSHIAPALLKIELTESTAMHNSDFVATLLGRVGELGVGVAVDDFGTGYSSLSCLKRFPIGELKIDKSFVSGIAAGTNDAAIVRGTIALAHGLGMTVVAEGVETQHQLDFLGGHRCNVAQGYLFARPLPADEARQWLIAPPAPAAMARAKGKPDRPCNDEE
ncbi:MAG: EAL domain-containing protein [Candidatus Accumulibacter phosphatis]|uniref:EAL domain-containing protein n=1 Tax=Candidatus Accumulibacter phosphatis TaxID=327160 RepID=UPI001A397850|nr:EAL domain-containing protein [Candidatus Accumulibacter phosphatis]